MFFEPSRLDSRRADQSNRNLFCLIILEFPGLYFQIPLDHFQTLPSQLGFLFLSFSKKKIAGIPKQKLAMVKYKKVYPKSQKTNFVTKKNPLEKFVRKICDLKELVKLRNPPNT